MAEDASWSVLDDARIGPTVEHLHRLVQIGGKYTLGDLFEPGWGNIVLGVTPRGLRTPVLHQDGRTFEVHYRLLDGDTVIESADGRRALPLETGSVADFYRHFVGAAEELGVGAPASSLACEIPGASPLDVDTETRSWNPEAARAIWTTLSQASNALRRWQAPFRGYRPTVGVMWGAFDLSSTRYRGRYLDPPADRPAFLQHGMTEEYVSVGFAFGTDTSPAGFYAYLAPQPHGIESWSRWGVEQARWDQDAGLVVLPWNALAEVADPTGAVVTFGDAVYRAAVELAGWPADLVMARFDGWHASTTPPDNTHRSA